MAVFIDSIIKECMSYVYEFAATSYHTTRKILDLIFNTETSNKPSQKQEAHWSEALFTAVLAVYIYITFELLIKPAVEHTSLYIWLKSLPTICYYTFLTLSTATQITLATSVLLSIGAAIFLRKRRHTEKTLNNKQNEAKKQASEQEKEQLLKKLAADNLFLIAKLQALQQQLKKEQEAKEDKEKRLPLETLLDRLHKQYKLAPLSLRQTNKLAENSIFTGLQTTMSQLLSRAILSLLDQYQAEDHADNSRANQLIDDIREEINTLQAISADYTQCQAQLQTLIVCRDTLQHAQQQHLDDALTCLQQLNDLAENTDTTTSLVQTQLQDHISLLLDNYSNNTNRTADNHTDHSHQPDTYTEEAEEASEACVIC